MNHHDQVAAYVTMSGVTPEQAQEFVRAYSARYPTHQDTRAREALTEPESAEEMVGNVRLVEHYSRREGRLVSEVATNPMYAPIGNNEIIGRRVSSEGLDWGIYSIKHDYVGRQEDYDDHNTYYWDSFRRQAESNLRSFGVEWEPELRF